MTAAWTFLREFLERLQGPDTPLYWPFVASALLLMAAFLVVARRMRPWDALREVLSRKVWLTRSTRTDVAMTLLHEMFVAVPTLAVAAYVSDHLFTAFCGHLLPSLGGGLRWNAPLLVQSVVVTALLMLAFDLGTFIAHRLHHAFPVLWEIHAVHHSAEHLTLFTAHRLHPIEPLMRGAIQGACSGCVLAAIETLFGRVAPTITVWGLGVGFFLFSFTNHLLHAHVPVRYPQWLRRLLISPHIHHLHHSRAPAHRDRNFGAIFSIWDRLCGTYLDVEFEQGEVAFGLDGEDPFRHSLVRCYLVPLLVPFERLAAIARRRRVTSP